MTQVVTTYIERTRTWEWIKGEKVQTLKARSDDS